jgi:O-antigen/teichoic acid export membrane protein
VFGLNGAGVRFIAESLGEGSPRRAREAFNLCITTALTSTCFVSLLSYIALATFGADLFRDEQLQQLAPLIAGCVALFAGMQLTSELLRSFHELRFASLLNGPSGGALSMMLFVGMLTVALCFGRPTLNQVVLLQLVSMAVILPFGIVWLLRTCRRSLQEYADEASPRLLTLSQLLNVCVPLMLTQLLAIAAGQADLWVGGTSLPKDGLALYGAARRTMVMVALPTQMVGLIVMSSIPDLYAQRRIGDLQRLLQSSAMVAALPSFAALVASLVAPQWILGVLFGDFYRDGATVLMLLGIAQFVASVLGPANYALSLTGCHNSGLVIYFVTSVVFFLVGPFAARNWGLTGLAVVSGLTTACQAVALWALARIHLGLWTHAAMRPGSMRSMLGARAV